MLLISSPYLPPTADVRGCILTPLREDARRRACAHGSRDDVLHDAAAHVGEAEVAAAVAVGQALVVDAHEVQNRRVQVVDVDLVLDGVPAEVVGGPIGEAAL